MIALRDAMQELLQDWRDDIDPAWRSSVDPVRLGYGDISSDLMLEPWEPIFPARRGRNFPGQPDGAHIFRAFDGIEPSEVRCVLLGQDPYPCPAFSTGRAFEAGNTGCWRELNKMFSRSVRAFLLQIVAARTGCAEIAADFSQWPAALSKIESGEIPFEPPPGLADRWVKSGVLLLNSSLTLSRFSVNLDPHQSEGHLCLWKPLILSVLRQLAQKGQPLAVITFGDIAADRARQALAGAPTEVWVAERPHPADADRFLACGNPFLACNEFLRRHGARPADW